MSLQLETKYVRFVLITAIVSWKLVESTRVKVERVAGTPAATTGNRCVWNCNKLGYSVSPEFPRG